MGKHELVSAVTPSDESDRVEPNLRQGMATLKISCDSVTSAMVSSPPPQSPNGSSGSARSRRSDASSPDLQPHKEGRCKTDTIPKARKVKMGSRLRRAAAKQRLLQRRAFKGPAKIYRADESNFRDLVYQHTCQIQAVCPPPLLPWEPGSPASCISSASASAWSSVSSPCSPFSMYSTGSDLSSDFTSPQSSPRHGPSERL